MSAAAFPVRFPDQLRPYLRALRKARGLTQAQLGEVIGVSQARIAEIEARPGLVSFDQLMKLLSALGVTLVLQEEAAAAAMAPMKRTKALPKPRSPDVPPKTPGVWDAVPFVVRPKKGSW